MEECMSRRPAAKILQIAAMLLISLDLTVGAGLDTCRALSAEAAQKPSPSNPAKAKLQRTDVYGDPLPKGALARMGTIRGRLPDLVRACIFSRDGKTLVAAGYDKAIHLFDAQTRRPLHQLRHHKEPVTSLAFAPDGKLLVSGGSFDGTLCFWEWPSGKMLRQFAAHKAGMKALAFAGTGKFVASCGAIDQLIRLWDPATGRELRQYKGHKKSVTALAVSPDGRFVASGDSDGVQLWEAASGRLLRRHTTSGLEWAGSLAFSPDSKWVAIPEASLKIALCNVATGGIVRRFSAQMSGPISGVAFSPDGRTLAAAAGPTVDAATNGFSLVLWDAANGEILHRLPGRNNTRFSGDITCLSFSPDGRQLAFGEYHCVRVWDLASWREAHPLEGHANRVRHLQFSLDSKSLATVADDMVDAIQEWDTATGKKSRTLWNKYLIGQHGFHLSPDHGELTIVHTDEKELLLDCRNTLTGKEIRRVRLPFNKQEGYNPAVLSPDGKIITNEWGIPNHFSKPILLRKTTNGKSIGSVSGYFGRCYFSPDSQFLACSDSRRVGLFYVPADRIVWTLPLDSRDDHLVDCLTFSHDSLLAAVASSSSEDAKDARSSRIDIWETHTGKKRTTMTVGRTSLEALAFSPDGALLAGGDDEGVLHLWSMATGKKVLQLSGHHGRIASLVFSQDGKRLASGSWDTTALIWDIGETAESVRPQPTEVSKDRLERLWADLAGDDGEQVHRAIWTLAACPQFVPWLREHLKPVTPVDPKQLAQWIADLDSDAFEVREKATRELEARREAAEPTLRSVLAGKPSLEVRRRVESILKKLDELPSISPSTLRTYRALEVLEHLGTPEARHFLQHLAAGLPEARLTREAQASLQRLSPSARPAVKP
jgi:WD40 repeat protein